MGTYFLRFLGFNYILYVLSIRAFERASWVLKPLRSLRPLLACSHWGVGLTEIGSSYLIYCKKNLKMKLGSLLVLYIRTCPRYSGSGMERGGYLLPKRTDMHTEQTLTMVFL